LHQHADLAAIASDDIVAIALVAAAHAQAGATEERDGRRGARKGP
jgi:hypothetical protein